MGVAPRTIGREIHHVTPTNYRKHDPCSCLICSNQKRFFRQGIEDREIFTRAGGSLKTLTPPDPYEGLSYYDKWNRVYDDTLLEVLDEAKAVHITDELVPAETEPTLADVMRWMAWMVMLILLPVAMVWVTSWDI